MSQKCAKKILDVVLRHAAEQDAALVEIEGMCTPEEFDQYKKMVGKSMGTMLLYVINPIIAIYPDLKPPEMT
jgi:hypothetical protein